MRFSQAPLCRYHFKIIFDDITFLLSGNIIEYICFWRRYVALDADTALNNNLT